MKNPHLPEMAIAMTFGHGKLPIGLRLFRQHVVANHAVIEVNKIYEEVVNLSSIPPLPYAA